MAPERARSTDRGAIYGNTVIGDATRPFWITNPDLLTSRIRIAERKSLREANVKAVTRIEAWLRASIDAHQSIGVETVLSTNKYRKLVRAAQQRGFEIRLVYVILNSPELNVDRVKTRVEKGGTVFPPRRSRSVGVDRSGSSRGSSSKPIGHCFWTIRKNFA